MSQPTSMGRVEMKAMQATIRDGITEMLLGSILLIFGVLFYFAAHLAALGVLFQLLLIPLGKLLKRKYVYPRISGMPRCRKIPMQRVASSGPPS